MATMNPAVLRAFRSVGIDEPTAIDAATGISDDVNALASRLDRMERTLNLIVWQVGALLALAGALVLRAILHG